MNRLWPDTAVEEGNLTQNIFEVRKALGEKPGEQRFIATVARRGYRFVCDVRPIAEEASAHDDAVADDSRRSQPLVRSRRVERRTAMSAGVAAAIVLAMVGTTLFVASRRRAANAGTPPPSARNLTRMTYGPGLQIDVSWSPDGRRIAYAWDKDANFDPWVQSVDSEEPARVTSSPANETQPAWSPDGERLVFRSEEDGGGLFTVNVRGGPTRRVAPYGQHPAWMPNGRDVIFLDNHYPRSSPSAPMAARRPGRSWKVSSSGACGGPARFILTAGFR